MCLNGADSHECGCTKPDLILDQAGKKCVQALSPLEAVSNIASLGGSLTKIEILVSTCTEMSTKISFDRLPMRKYFAALDIDHKGVLMCGGYNPSDLNQTPLNSCSYVNFHGRVVSDFWVEPQVSHASLVRLQAERYRCCHLVGVNCVSEINFRK